MICIAVLQCKGSLRSLLRLHPAVEKHLSQMGPSQIVKLVYRDSLELKHSSKKRLHREIQQQVQDHPGAKRDRKSILDVGSTEIEDPMSKLLIKYLLQAWGMGASKPDSWC